MASKIDPKLTAKDSNPFNVTHCGKHCGTSLRHLLVALLSVPTMVLLALLVVVVRGSIAPESAQKPPEISPESPQKPPEISLEIPLESPGDLSVPSQKCLRHDLLLNNFLYTSVTLTLFSEKTFQRGHIKNHM